MFSMRVGQNVYDPQGKQAKNDYLSYLKMNTSLQEKYSEANSKFYRDQKLGIEPVPVEETNAQKNIDDFVKQREIAFKNLKRITTSADAGNILFQLLENPDQLKLFNRFFSGFQKDVGLQENITLPIFNLLWNRYKAKLASTKETGITIGPEQEEFNAEIDAVKNKIVAAANEAVGANDINREEFKTIIARANEEAGSRNYLKLLDLFNSFQKTLSESSKLNVEAVKDEIIKQELRMNQQIEDEVKLLDTTDPNYADNVKKIEEKVKNKFSAVLNLLNSVSKTANINLETFENQLQAEKDKLETEASRIDLEQKALLLEEEELKKKLEIPGAKFTPEDLQDYRKLSSDLLNDLMNDINELQKTKKTGLQERFNAYKSLYGPEYADDNGFNKKITTKSGVKDYIYYLISRKYNVVPPSIGESQVGVSKQDKSSFVMVAPIEKIKIGKLKKIKLEPLSYFESIDVTKFNKTSDFNDALVQLKDKLQNVKDNLRQLEDIGEIEDNKDDEKIRLDAIDVNNDLINKIKKEIKKIIRERKVFKIKRDEAKAKAKARVKAEELEKEKLKALPVQQVEELKYEKPKFMKAVKIVKKESDKEKEKKKLEKEMRKWEISVQNLVENIPDEKETPKKYEESLKAIDFQNKYIEDLRQKIKDLDEGGSGFSEFRLKKYNKGRGIMVENIPEDIGDLEEEKEEVCKSDKNIFRKNLFVKNTIKLKGMPCNSDRYVPFGIYFIHVPNLYKGYFKLVYSSLSNIRSIPRVLISDTLRQIIYNLITDNNLELELIEKLDDDELKFLENVVSKSRIDLNSVRGIYDKTMLLNNSKNTDLKRFKLLKGEILSGNDAPALLKEFKLLLIKMTSEGVIDKLESSKVMYDLLCLTT